MNEWNDRLIEMVRAQIPAAHREGLSRESGLREVGIDSLGLVLILARVMNEHKIVFRQIGERVARLRTVEDLIAMVGEARAAAADAATSGGRA
jgi:acyl carrier protein